MNSFATQYAHLLKAILEQGQYVKSRTGNALELIGATYAFGDAEALVLNFPDELAFNWEFAISLADAIISGDRNADNIINMSARSKQFVTVPSEYAENVCIMYGPRFVSQLPFVLAELSKAGSRRAIIYVGNAEDAIIAQDPQLAHLEYPCTDSWQFFLRDGFLHMHTHFRSQLAWPLLPIDTYIAIRLQKHIAGLLGVYVGNQSASAGSLHLCDWSLPIAMSWLRMVTKP